MGIAEVLSRCVYVETAEFYNKIRPRMGDNAFGFKILYGPPILKPPVLFVGYQPGGSAKDDEREQAAGAHEHWPEVLEYATGNWQLARNMRSMFDLEKLKGCVGLNAIFFRAPDEKKWKKTIPLDLRDEIRSFCLPRVERIIDVMQPALVVAIGFKALRLFDETEQPDQRNQSGLVITRSGLIGGYPALATLHLTGYPILTEDRIAIAKRVGLAK